MQGVRGSNPLRSTKYVQRVSVQVIRGDARVGYRRTRAAAFTGLVLALTVTGCSTLGINLPGHAVYKDIRAQLDETTGSTSVEVNLADVVDGGWTRVVTVCSGATARQIDDALGFSWAESDSVDDDDFIGMFVFADQAKVTDYYSAGMNEAAENLDLLPCHDPQKIDIGATRVFELARSDSRVQFRYWANGGYWYSVPPSAG
jgi:hypothetical protein